MVALDWGMWIKVGTKEDLDEVMKQDPIRTAVDATRVKVGGTTKDANAGLMLISKSSVVLESWES